MLWLLCDHCVTLVQRGKHARHQDWIIQCRLATPQILCDFGPIGIARECDEIRRMSQSLHDCDEHVHKRWRRVRVAIKNTMSRDRTWSSPLSSSMNDAISLVLTLCRSTRVAVSPSTVAIDRMACTSAFSRNSIWRRRSSDCRGMAAGKFAHVCS